MGGRMNALVQAGASILGGLLGKSKGIKPSEQAFGHVKGLMRASEEYGFNPLTLLQAGVPGGHTADNNAPMGQAFADAAMFAADAFLKKGNQQALLVNQYQEQNRQLQERLTHVTLNPKVPGIFGGGDASSYGQGGVGAVQGVGGSHIPVPDPYLDIGSGTYVNGEFIEPTPGWSPANVYENEYGEVGGSVMGLGKLAVDMSGEAKRWLAPRAAGASTTLKGGVDWLKAKSDANRKYGNNHTVGVPLAAPWGLVNRTWELLPGRTYKAKPKSSVKYDLGWVQ